MDNAASQFINELMQSWKEWIPEDRAATITVRYTPDGSVAFEVHVDPIQEPSPSKFKGKGRAPLPTPPKRSKT